jgi:hypothetical protein
VSVITTHALFALKVQRKVSNGIAGFAAAGSSWIDRNLGNSCAISAMQLDDQYPRENAYFDPGIRPELHIANTAAQTRMVSGVEFLPS